MTVGLAWWNISVEIRAVEDKLNARVDALEGNLTARMDADVDKLNARIDVFEGNLTDRIDRNNGRVDAVNQSLVGLQGQVSGTQATLEAFIDEHIGNHENYAGSGADNDVAN